MFFVSSFLCFEETAQFSVVPVVRRVAYVIVVVEAEAEEEDDPRSGGAMESWKLNTSRLFSFLFALFMVASLGPASALNASNHSLRIAFCTS